MKIPGTTERWWLVGADEQCPHCDAIYAWEAETWCAECDSPMCPLCASWSDHRAHCPACAESSG